MGAAGSGLMRLGKAGSAAKPSVENSSVRVEAFSLLGKKKKKSSRVSSGSCLVSGLQCYGCNIVVGTKNVDMGCSNPEVITCSQSHQGFKHRFCIKTESGECAPGAAAASVHPPKPNPAALRLAQLPLHPARGPDVLFLPCSGPGHPADQRLCHLPSLPAAGTAGGPHPLL